MSEKKPLNYWVRKELFALPRRSWDKESLYDSVLLLSTRKKHDSGWAMISIIGVVNGEPIEISTECSDDIEWILPDKIRLTQDISVGQMRMDCAMKSGAMHAWMRGHVFKVGCSLSSITIEVLRK